MNLEAIKIDLSTFFETNDVRRKAFIFVNPKWKNVSCLQNHIKNIFDIDVNLLTKDGCYIPPHEPIQIIKNLPELRGISIKSESKDLKSAGDLCVALPSTNQKSTKKRQNCKDVNSLYLNEPNHKRIECLNNQLVLPINSNHMNQNTAVEQTLKVHSVATKIELIMSVPPTKPSEATTIIEKKMPGKSFDPIIKSTVSKQHLFVADEDENEPIQSCVQKNTVQEDKSSEITKICVRCNLNEDVKPRISEIQTMQSNQRSSKTEKVLIEPAHTDMSSIDFGNAIQRDSMLIANNDSIVEPKESKDALENLLKISENPIRKIKKETDSEMSNSIEASSSHSLDSSVVINIDTSESDEATMHSSKTIPNILCYCTKLKGLPKVDDVILFKTFVKGSSTELTGYLAGTCKKFNKRKNKIQILITDGHSEMDKIEKLCNVKESKNNNLVTLKFDELIEPKVYTVPQ